MGINYLYRLILGRALDKKWLKQMTETTKYPLPIFDTLKKLDKQTRFDHLCAAYFQQDLQMARSFLLLYRGSQGTFNSYRREIERLIHWCALVVQKPLSTLSRHDIENYIDFCRNPPTLWIGVTKPARFSWQDGIRYPNRNWRPFVATVSKAHHQQGIKPTVKDFELNPSSVREIFAILGSFFQFLIQEEYALSNPIALIRQKSKFIRKSQSVGKIRRLSERQWQYVIETTKQRADDFGGTHERSLFILSALYGMYLRISELAESERWQPMMNDFYRDSQENWWFTTVGKGNKEREIAVSDAMLSALRRWRQHLNLTPLPTPGDSSPLLPKTKGKGAIKSINFIRQIVQQCFDSASDKLLVDGFEEEANALTEATVHWLRHTGISDDVKIRPREHVRDDAGHSSSAITDHYIDIERHERHRSAQVKVIHEKEK